MKEVIQKAIEGGYERVIIDSNGMAQSKNGMRGYVIPKEVILLDPLFWQSLGKALGWNKGFETGYCQLCGEPMLDGEEMFKLHGYSGNCTKPPRVLTEWKTEWHRFIDHLAEGKDPEEFFNGLISKEK